MNRDTHSTRTTGAVVQSRRVGGTRFDGRAGRDFVAAPPARSDRQLDAATIRRSLPRAPRFEGDYMVDFIVDLSGSMTGGNDVSATRLEASLIGVEHLAAAQRRNSSWNLRITSFDRRSALDLEATKLDRRGLDLARDRLLTKPLGGSSNLGPALQATEAAPHSGRLLVIHSDFELFDHDQLLVLNELINSNATHVLALVYRSTPPPQLSGTRVEVHRIDPSNTKPADIARLIVTAATTAVHNVEQAQHSGIDVEDPESKDEEDGRVIQFDSQRSKP